MAESSRGLAAYLREAFLFRWNLLFFGGGVAAALLTPIPEVILPLVAAGELTYLAGLVSMPKFRAAIDAKEHAGRVASAPAPVAVPPLPEHPAHRDAAEASAGRPAAVPAAARPMRGDA